MADYALQKKNISELKDIVIDNFKWPRVLTIGITEKEMYRKKIFLKYCLKCLQICENYKSSI
jgi:hypothetical protein